MSRNLVLLSCLSFMLVHCSGQNKSKREYREAGSQNAATSSSVQTHESEDSQTAQTKSPTATTVPKPSAVSQGQNPVAIPHQGAENPPLEQQSSSQSWDGQSMKGQGVWSFKRAD